MTEREPGEQGVIAAAVGLAAGRGVWVVVPTYNERENLEGISTAILSVLLGWRVVHRFKTKARGARGASDRQGSRARG